MYFKLYNLKYIYCESNNPINIYIYIYIYMYILYFLIYMEVQVKRYPTD